MNDECVTHFNELKLGKKITYIIYKLKDDLQEIVFEKESSNTDYTEFVKALPESDCRYAVYDFPYIAEDGGNRNKILFVLWYVPSPQFMPSIIAVPMILGVMRYIVWG